MFDLWPTSEMCYEQKLNAITRLIIIITILGYILTMNNRILVAGFFTLLVIFVLYKMRKQKITKDTQLNRLNDDIRSEFDKIKWMIDEYTQVQHKQIKFRDELIELLTNQVVDLTMMSKIELGGDVITEIKRLKNIINE
jgi:hypothetical protein